MDWSLFLILKFDTLFTFAIGPNGADIIVVFDKDCERTIAGDGGTGGL